jgi:protein YIPF1/2
MIDFMLSSAEEDLLAGKIPTASKEPPPVELPMPVQQQQQQQQQQSQDTSAFWTFAYWQKYFNVDTKDVTTRMLSSLWPLTSFSTVSADLYGPFWIPTTVIFCLFATSSLAESIARTWAGKEMNVFDITVLSYASITVYSYVIALPALIYFIGRYFKSEHVFCN